MGTALTEFDDRHLAGVLALCATEGWPTFPSDPDRAQGALHAPGAVTVVAVCDEDRVVGFAHALTDSITAHLAQLLVDQQHQGQGIGRRLVDEVGRRCGTDRLDLLTDTARGFYKRLPHRRYTGFRVYPTRP